MGNQINKNQVNQFSTILATAALAATVGAVQISTEQRYPRLSGRTRDWSWSNSSAGEGETCGGFNESTGAPYPSCAAGLECVDSGLFSIGGGASNVCKAQKAGEGETCGGFNESTGKPYPSCADGLTCVNSGLITIGGGAGNVCEVAAGKGETCEGFNE